MLSARTVDRMKSWMERVKWGRKEDIVEKKRRIERKNKIVRKSGKVRKVGEENKSKGLGNLRRKRKDIADILVENDSTAFLLNGSRTNRKSLGTQN